MTKKEREGNQSTNEEREMKLGQLNNEVKQLQNQLEHFRSSENDIRVRTCWNFIDQQGFDENLADLVH